ncbi:MAG: hypothetical protein ACYC5Q_17045, partial [Thermoleophilia bacterium]
MIRVHEPTPPVMSTPHRRDTGSAIVIVMMFAFVFLAMGLGLFFLVLSSIRGTELESKEVKAFNVAEAGVDAGMLALRTNWPEASNDLAIADETAFEAAFRGDFDAAKFRDPTRSPASDFIGVDIRDNSGTIYDPTALPYDANGDNLVYIASEANVDDDRHRIIILAERKTWNLSFPLIAMYTSSFDANGQGLDISIDPQQTEPLPHEGTAVPAYYNAQVGKKGLDLGANVIANPSDPGSFDSWVGTALMSALKGIAQTDGTYFTNPATANTFLLSAAAPGKITYLETTSAVEIGGNTPIGSRTNPVVLVIDAGGQDIGLDFKGTADFFGIVVVKGNPFIRGTSSIYGSFIASGLLTNQGNGVSPEINYNGNIIKQINRAY